jgi:hypothetical protein
MIKKRFAV